MRLPFNKSKIINTFIKVEKRLRFVISTLLLSFLLLFSTFFFFDKAWFFVPLFIVATYALSYFSILEDIAKIELLMLFIVPVMFTVALYFFYFLFPVRWLTRVPFIVIYAISIYAILLTSNIFNVGVEKSLQLYRAAFSVNYFYHAVIVFLVSNILFSLRASFITNGLLTAAVFFPLGLHLFWSIKLNLSLDKTILIYAVFNSLLLAQIAIVGSFVPFQRSIFALILTSSYYCFTGLIAAHLDNRLFKQTVREFLIVLGVVLVIAILTLSWG